MKMPQFSLLAALAAGFLIALTPNLRAEDKPEKPNRPERPAAGQRGDMLKDMAEKLNLTADQKAKLQEAFRTQREAMKDLTPEERRAKMKETRAALNASVKEILTAEQYAKWEKLREENRAAGANGPGPGGNAGGPKAGKPAKN